MTICCCDRGVQLLQKLITTRRLVMDSLKANNKLSTDTSLATKLGQISQLFDRLHYVTEYSYTLLRHQLSLVSQQDLHWDLGSPLALASTPPGIHIPQHFGWEGHTGNIPLNIIKL